MLLNGVFAAKSLSCRTAISGLPFAAAPTHYMAVALQIELSAKTTAELKDLLRDRGQQVKGTKAELIERIAPLLLREAAVTEAMDTLGCTSLSLSLSLSLFKFIAFCSKS